MREYNKRMNDELLREFARLLDQGMTCKECGEILDQPAQYLSNVKRRLLNRDNGTKGKYTHWSIKRIKEVEKMRNEGASYNDIADAFGVTYHSIYGVIKRYEKDSNT